MLRIEVKNLLVLIFRKSAWREAKIRLVLCGLLIFAWSSATSAHANFDEQIQNQLLQTGGHGAAIVVARDREVIATRVYGEDPITGKPWNEDSLFRIASVSKIVMASAALQVFAERGVALSTPLHQVLPALKIDNPWRAEHPIELRHLLEHTSGIHEVIAGWSDEPQPLQALIDSAFERVTVRFPPGTTPIYSNYNYVTLNAVVEEITGSPFDTVIRDYLFAPLGMSS